MLTVVVMTFNEVASLQPVVMEVTGVVRGLGMSYEILIVDDGSADGSGAVADTLASEFEAVRVIHHPENLGLGGVYRTGFREAKGAALTFFPADGQFPASIIAEFAPLMRDHDLVLGYLPARPRSVVGRALSAAERFLYRALFGPLPRFQGIMMLRRSLLTAVPLRSAGRGWAIVMELLIRVSRADYRIRSLPTGIRPRLAGRSKVNNFRTIWANFRQMLALRKLL